MDGGLVVTTTSGPVIGLAAAGVVSFLGIPYAAPPIGEKRWKPTEPLTWTTARPALAFLPACPQDTADAGFAQSEDCLGLNVWTPSLQPAAPMPVMVFIHGGGFKNGSGSRPTYLDSTLPSKGVVLITFNYRLGNLGFLAHPLLTAESAHQASGNYGLLDQIAALDWVKKNAAAFGGDPSRITVFGESAGSISTCLHVFMPASRGLFSRAIGESGSCLVTRRPLAAAETLGQAFAQQAQCTTLACLRGLSVEQITAVPAAPDVDFGLGVASPTVDGWVLPESPEVALAARRVNPVAAFVGGINRDEATLFTIGHTITTEAQLRAAIATMLPHHVDDVLGLYPPMSTAYPTYKSVYDAATTDALFTCPTKAQVAGLAAAGVPSWLYRFEKETALGTASGLGVFHGSELPFVFGNVVIAPASRLLSAQMQTWWTNVAKSADPGTPWTGYVPANDNYLVINDTSSMRQGLRSAECTALTQWLMNP